MRSHAVNTPRRIASRLFVRTALSVAAGFLSTIAVAWTSAYFYPCPFNASCLAATTAGPVVGDPRAKYPLQGTIERYDTRLASFVRATSPIRIVCALSLDGDDSASRPNPCDNWPEYVPPWAFRDISEVLSGDGNQFLVLACEAHGWPAKSWRFDARLVLGGRGTRNTSAPELLRGLPVSHRNHQGMLSFRGYGAVLPYGPIWPGIALNASLVAVPLFILTTIAPHLRAALRRRRARCPKCNYDLRGHAPSTPCPECGSTM
jgi:hypothetical protein